MDLSPCESPGKRQRPGSNNSAQQPHTAIPEMNIFSDVPEVSEIFSLEEEAIALDAVFGMQLPLFL